MWSTILFYFLIFLNVIWLVFLWQKEKKIQRIKQKKESLLKNLEELKFFNQKVLDNVPVSIIVMDKEGNVLLTNSYFKEIVPWHSETEKFNIFDSQRLKEAGLTQKYENVLKTGISFSQKSVMFRAPQKFHSYYLNLDVIPLKDDDNQVIGAISIGQEITPLIQARNNLEKINDKLNLEVKKRTQEFYELNDQLHEKISFYEKIFGYLVRQLNGPVQQIKYLLADPAISPELKEIHRHIYNVIHDFSYLNSIEKNELVLTTEKVKIIDLFRQTISNNKLLIEADDEIEGLEINLDREKISHVLKSIHKRLNDFSSQSIVSAEKRGHLLHLKWQYNFSQQPEFSENSFFWDVQLLIYKEIINLHKGVLEDKSDANSIIFEMKLLVN